MLQTRSAAGLSADEAAAEAVRTRRPVVASALTTESSTVTANPSGTFTSTTSLQPSRRKVNGVWQPLDATLHVNQDGSVSPNLSFSDVRFSGGGSAPLAVQRDTDVSLSVSLPMTLPEPTLSGATATYTGVLPGVDLIVTADDQGGYGEVLRVADATAAAQPALKRLKFTTSTSGLTLKKDSAGNLAAVDRWGRARFTAPSPVMWDSSGSAAERSGFPAPAARGVVPATALAAMSPNAANRIAPLSTELVGDDVVLTPDAGLLTGPDTVYPVYIDPTWISTHGSVTRWGDVKSAWPTTTYPSPSTLQVGYQGWQTTYFKSRSYLQFSFPSVARGALINSATLTIAETYAPSCTARAVNLMRAKATFTSSLNWNNQPGYSTELDSVSAAHGYSSSCTAAGITFASSALTSYVREVAGTSGSSAVTWLGLVLKADDEGDKYGWKKFAMNSSTTIAIEYDHAPVVGTRSTSVGACTKTTAPDGPVTLDVIAKDADAVGNLTATFTATANSATLKTGTVTVAESTTGTHAQFTLEQGLLETAAAGSSTPGKVTVSWNVTLSDGQGAPAVTNSTPCSFVFDATRVATPGYSFEPNRTLGQQVTVTMDDAPGTLAQRPTRYLYQINGSALLSVNANANAATTFKVLATRIDNVVTVIAVSSSGAQAEPNSSVLSVLPAVQTPGDLNSDKLPDHLAVGGTGSTSGAPSGIWLGTATSTGTLNPVARNVGAYGYSSTTPKPSAFNGMTALVGSFSGTGMQDVAVYKPSSPVGAILPGTGDGSPLDSSSAVELVTPTQYGSVNPVQLATAAPTTGDLSDLIGVFGDSENPYTLAYVPSLGIPGLFSDVQALDALSAPDGTMNWNQWTITTAQNPSTLKTQLLLWKKSTGDLWVWRDLVWNPDTAALTVASQSKLASGFLTGQSVGLQASFIGTETTPALRVTASGNKVTTYHLVGSTWTALTATSLLTPSHVWSLADGSTGTAADDSGTVPLTATGSAIPGDYSDGFLTASDFDGTAQTVKSASGVQAFNPAKDFTVSAWVRPMTLGRAVLSQQGSLACSLRLLTTTDGHWQVGMATGDVTTGGYHVVTAGTVTLGTWAHLAVTYVAATSTLTLYVNGTSAGTVTHAPVTWATANNTFNIGTAKYSGVVSGHFNGQLGDVLVWASALPASAMPTLP